MHVLIIDDEEHMYKMAALFFKGANHHSTIATSTRQGLELLLPGEPQFDLILTDLNQHPPGTEVYATAKAIYGPDFPVYIITGGAFGSLMDQAIHLAGQKLLHKPFNLNSLIPKMEQESRAYWQQRNLITEYCKA